jgi:hypothetical protein
VIVAVGSEVAILPMHVIWYGPDSKLVPMRCAKMELVCIPLTGIMAARDRSNEEVDQDCGGANFASVPKRDGTDRVAALT